MGEPRLLLRYLFDSSFISEGTQGDPSLCELQSSNSDTILFKKSSQLWAWEETSGRILCPRNGLIFLFFKFFFFLVNIFTTFQMFQTWLALKQTLVPLAFSLQRRASMSRPLCWSASPRLASTVCLCRGRVSVPTGPKALSSALKSNRPPRISRS